MYEFFEKKIKIIKKYIILEMLCFDLKIGFQ